MSAQEFLFVQASFLVARDPLGDFQAAVADKKIPRGLTLESFQDLSLFFQHHLSVIGIIRGTYQHVMLLQVQLAHHVLAGPVKVDRAGMTFSQGAASPDSAHCKMTFPADIEDGKTFSGHAQVYIRMGTQTRRDQPSLHILQQAAAGFQRFEHAGRVLALEDTLSGLNRQLACGALQMAGQDELIIRIHQGALAAPAGKSPPGGA